MSSYYSRNLEKCKDTQKKYREKNKEALRLKKQEYYKKNRDLLILKQKEYNSKLENKIKRRTWAKKHYESKRNNLDYIIPKRLRTRLYRALKGISKDFTTLELLGCTIEELRKHLESKFQEGMTWENYGYDGWHIDHIKPLASFNLEDTEALTKACHYTNLQPLWGHENISKGAKLCQ